MASDCSVLLLDINCLQERGDDKIKNVKYYQYEVENK